MKKRRAKHPKLDAEMTYLVKVWGPRMSSYRSWLKAFTRVNNRRKRFFAADVEAAGYPSAHLNKMSEWQEVHLWCREAFGSGYVWFGNVFFFLSEADRDEFSRRWC